MEQANSEQKSNIIGISPRTVKMYGFALAGFLMPIFGIVPSIIALAKAKKAKREILLSSGTLAGLDLYKKSLTYAWLGVSSFIFNVALIVFIIWLINVLPSFITSPQFQDVIQNNLPDIITEVPINIDLESLGFSESDISVLRDALPDGVDINNLTLDDILKLAEEYGIN
jgi:hypothetical protein